MGNLASDQRGQVTPFVVILAVAVVMFAGLVVDGGLALAAKVRAIGEAQEAGRAGAQALDLAAYRDSGTVRLVPDGARTLAQNYLASTSDSGTVTVIDDTVTVTVTARQHTQLLGLLGLDSLTVIGSGSAHPARGITAEDREFANSEGVSGANPRVVGSGG
nr:pilus assembly protein TadG-related protein [Streptomyces cupreus]